MYWCIDGILTWGEVMPVRPVKFRRPYVPQHGVPDGPRYLYLGSKYFNLVPPDRS